MPRIRGTCIVIAAAALLFVLDDSPPGVHTIVVWHELLGSRERQVTVRPGETATVDFELEALAPEAP